MVYLNIFKVFKEVIVEGQSSQKHRYSVLKYNNIVYLCVGTLEKEGWQNDFFTISCGPHKMSGWAGFGPWASTLTHVP